MGINKYIRHRRSKRRCVWALPMHPLLAVVAVASSTALLGGDAGMVPLATPPADRTHSRSRRQVATSAGVAGLGLGWLTTPRLTPQDLGTVRTAEAWRRRVKQRSRIPLFDRSPRIIGVGALCYTLAEYKMALDSGASHKASLMQTTVVACALSAALEANTAAVALKAKVLPVARVMERSLVVCSLGARLVVDKARLHGEAFRHLCAIEV